MKFADPIRNNLQSIQVIFLLDNCVDLRFGLMFFDGVCVDNFIFLNENMSYGRSEVYPISFFCGSNDFCGEGKNCNENKRTCDD